jgi:hypothetical protein
MNRLNTIFILIAVFLAVFWEAAFDGVRRLVGAQVDLLPALVVYASLTEGVLTVALVAACGGLWLDALSANPLGVSVLPLFLAGIVIHVNRDLLLRNQTYAQFILGLAASAAVPLMVLLALLTTGREPLLGWGSLWQWVVMSVGGGVATPVFFEMFRLANRALVHDRATETSFRPDREIRRGR